MNDDARTLIAVSLKLYFDHEQLVEWCDRVAELAREHPALSDGSTELIVLPSFPSIPAALDAFRDTEVAVGAQDLFWADSGAYTGEVSGRQLAQLGCRYVEVGHAERRRLGDGDEIVARKLAAAWRSGLVPVLCVGEEAPGPVAAAADRCAAQLRSALAAASGDVRGELVVAYEPEWAIGGEHAASAGHVRAVTSRLVDEINASPLVGRSRVIYGGSAGPGLLRELGGGVDGLFLGRSAHDPGALRSVLDEALDRGDRVTERWR